MGIPVPSTDLPVTSRVVPADDLPGARMAIHSQPAKPLGPSKWDTVKEAVSGAAKNTLGIAENIANQTTQLGAMTVTAIPNIIGSTGAELADAVVNERMPTFKGIGDRFHANLEPQIYQPQTDSGKQQVEATGKVMTAIPAVVDAVDDATGAPFKRNFPDAYAATQVAGEFLPWIVGGKALHTPGAPELNPRRTATKGKAVPAEDMPPQEVPPPDYTAKTEPASAERVQYEINLTLDPNTSKAAMMMPQLGTGAVKMVQKVAEATGLKPIKESGSFYLFNPEQTNAIELRAAIKNGTEGHLLGYGTEGVPATGIDYAVSITGKGTTDLPTIKQWRDSNELGFAGRALNAEMAAAKMQEMGAKQIEAPVIAPEAIKAPAEPLPVEPIQAPAPEAIKPSQEATQAPTFERLTPAGKRGNAPAFTPNISPSQHGSLREIRQEVIDGEAGKRVGIYNQHEPGTTQLAWGSSFPEYFQNKGLTKKQVVPVLDRILKGEPVTEAQWLMAEDLLKAKRYDTLNSILNDRAEKAANVRVEQDANWDSRLQSAEEYFAQRGGFDEITEAPTGSIRGNEPGGTSGVRESLINDPAKPEAPRTETIDGSGWTQDVGIEGATKAPEFGSKKPTGQRVGQSEFMDGFTPDPQADLFAPSPRNSHADTGGYAERTGPTRETTQTFIELPEMLKIAKLINEGKIPKLVERMGNALGRFSHNAVEAGIKLRKDLFAGPQIAAKSLKTAEARVSWEAWQEAVKDANPDADIIFRQKYNRKTGEVDFKAYKRDPSFVARVFAHEIGHNVDYLTDSMVRGRGNILGHVAALKKYMKHTLEMYPDAKGKALTPEDRARLAKEARAELRDGESITETVTREVPKYADAGVTPEMITEIWNGMADARNINPDLYKFIAKMSDAEKKAVVVQAMKGVVHESLQRLGKRKVGTETITETVTRPGKVSPEAIRRRTQQLIKEEIIKRRLYEKQVITEELKALSQKWKPFDDTADAGYTKYRYSSAELYADATSVLFNEPKLLKDTAPTFYKSFFYYMGERPGFKEAYTAISRMSKDPQALGKDRYAEEMAMYKRGNEKAEEIRKAEKPGEAIYNTAMRWLIDKNHSVLKELPDTAAGREARHNLEEIPYIAGEVENYVRKADGIRKDVETAGATIDDLSAYMLAKHIISNRDSIANTLGKTAATEQAKLDWMRQNLGADKFAALEKAASDYRAAREHTIARMEESGIVTPELLEKIKGNGEYAHIDVQAYMDQKYGQGTAAGAGWKKMAEGTLEDINNVYTATVLQDISIMRMAKINEAKHSITDIFTGNGLAKQAQMKYDPSFKGMRPVEPGGEQALLTVLEKGKPVYYVVDKTVVEMFHRDPVQALQIGKAAGLVQTFFRDILVSKNPAWMARNLFRDFKGTVKNNPEVSFWNPVDRWKLLKAYKQAFKEVRADVFHGKRSTDIETMHNEHMLNSDRMYSAKDDSFDNPLERISTEFRFGEQESANTAMRKLKAVYNYADKMGKVSEQTGKVAGMKFLRDKGLKDNDLSHRVRTRIGTPDYKRQGALQQTTNNLFLFSNVNKEGVRSAAEAFKHDPISYTFKTVEANILPKLALMAAGAGLFGEELKDTVNAIPSWVKRSYNAIPLPAAFTDWAIDKGIAGKKDVGYLRLPSDYEGQFFGSLVYDLANADIKGVVQDVKQQIPYWPSKIHPFLKLAYDWAEYLGGVTPYDSFRRKDVLTKEQQKYLEVNGPLDLKPLAGMGTHTWNMAGMGNVAQIENKEFPKQKAAEEAVFKQVMRYTGAFVEFSDAGKQEQMVKGIIEGRNKKALKSFEAGDAVNEAIRDGKDKPTDIPAVYKALVADKTIDPAKTRYGAFRARYMNSIMQKDYGIKPNSKAEQKTLRDFNK